MKSIVLKISACLLFLVVSGGISAEDKGVANSPVQGERAGETVQDADSDFQYVAERFSDKRVLRYKVPGFEELSLQKKKLLYYLCQAGSSGRDMIYDQKYKYNLPIKRTIETIMRHYPGDRTTEQFKSFVVYAKEVWFANGIHHHYSHDKFIPEFSYESLASYVAATKAEFPVRPGQTITQFMAEIKPVIFDREVDAKLVNQSKGKDLVRTSAVNFYGMLSQKQVESFYENMIDSSDKTPISYGLNSQLVLRDGKVIERVWKAGGMYSEAIVKVAYWLEKAAGVAENDNQKDALLKLVEYYKSGDLRDWDTYNIAWVADVKSDIDVINGFIEVYNDPLGYRGSFESVVSVKDPIATQRIEKLANEAQWFEDHSTIADPYKKSEVKGITARVINVVGESGDASPATPIGINLPNANWIRQHHGSKSVNLANIVNAYNQVSGASLSEFAWDDAEVKRVKEHGELAGALHTDMHEVIGHASGQLRTGVRTPKETLKSYASTIEEGRADLVALYYMMDEKLVDLGLMPSLETGKVAYDGFIRNGMMTQLRRIKEGKDIEEAHMRNRQWISQWVFERGRSKKIVERKTRDNKTYFVVNDYVALRELFGQLLREVQRIKSEGSFEDAQRLVESYGVKVDQELHQEVLARYAKLDVPAYSGFINPQLRPVMRDGEIVDVKIDYPSDFTKQMLDYAKEFSFLPAWN